MTSEEIGRPLDPLLGIPDMLIAKEITLAIWRNPCNKLVISYDYQELILHHSVKSGRLD